MALAGGVSVAGDGVKITDVVRAFEPAEAAEEDENDVTAPGPDVPKEAFARM
jgi:hypothetical protein